jgi:hypothetical protein
MGEAGRESKAWTREIETGLRQVDSCVESGVSVVILVSDQCASALTLGPAEEEKL